MWPHPPQRGAVPDEGLSSWQLDPVPEMSTIPPARQRERRGITQPGSPLVSLPLGKAVAIEPKVSVQTW